MAARKATDSKSISSEKDPRNKFQKALDADERLNVQYLQLDSHLPHLEDNDIWMYQMRLENFIRISLPDNMNQAYLNIVRLVCAQARRCNQPVDDEDVA